MPGFSFSDPDKTSSLSLSLVFSSKLTRADLKRQVQQPKGKARVSQHEQSKQEPKTQLPNHFQ
jgi:hypothetical protein